MHALRNYIPLLLVMFTLSGGTAQAAPLTNTPAPASVQSPASVPDYGGRDSSPLAVSSDAAPNPAAQAGRALEALVVVLAGVVGVVYLLKRFNLVKPGANGKPARISGPLFGRPAAGGSTDAAEGVIVVSSQTLPGGAMLHVVRVADRNLLLAATAQSVTNVAEWDVVETDSAGMVDEFEQYLTRADPTSGIAAANARLRSLLSPPNPEDPS